jgi:HK97 family phage major capsid protein
MTNGATNSPFLVYMNPAPQAEGGPLVQKLPMRLLGAPVYISEKVPALGTKGDVTLVDLSKQLVGDRMQLQIETSPHVYFTKNQMVWRVIARWDSQPWLNAPIKAADGSYQMSNAVVLN